MSRRTRRSSGSLLLDTAEMFRDVPFVYAAATAGLVALLFVVGAPILAASLPQTGSVDYVAMFVPLIRIIGAFLAAAILLFGAVGAVSRWIDRRSDRTRLDSQTGIDSIRRLSWQEFERLLGEAFRRQGFQVIRRGGAGPDGGVDLELRSDDEKLLVQAKHWRSRVVRLPQVRELWGAVADEHAHGAIFVTSGSFTDDAQRWTATKNLTLIDGAQLVGLIASVQVSAKASTTPATPGRLCGVCGRPMVLRTARRGPSVGQTFWGCSGYPNCRNTEAITSA